MIGMNMRLRYKRSINIHFVIGTTGSLRQMLLHVPLVLRKAELSLVNPEMLAVFFPGMQQCLP